MPFPYRSTLPKCLVFPEIHLRLFERNRLLGPLLIGFACSLAMRLFVSRCHIRRVLIILSMTFPTQLVRLMGLYLLVLSLSLPFLWIGIMFASLHFGGTCPVFQLKLKMSSMAALAFFPSCLIMSFVIWSGPGDLLVFRSSSASCNSFILKGCSIYSGQGSSLCNLFISSLTSCPRECGILRVLVSLYSIFYKILSGDYVTYFLIMQ